MGKSAWWRWALFTTAALALLAVGLSIRQCRPRLWFALWDGDPRAFPPVGDQCETGSCVAWATAYALTGHYAWRTAPDCDQALPRFQFSPSWLYNAAAGYANPSDPGGTWPDMTAQFAFCRLRDAGAARMDLMPFGCDLSVHPTPAACEDAALHRTGRFRGTTEFEKTLWPLDDGAGDRKRWDAVRDWLRDYGPVFVLMQVPRRFVEAFGARDYAIADGEDTSGPQHGLVCVGYDDYHFVGGSGRGCFRLRNSWGTCWGEAGSIWIPYDDAARLFVQVLAPHGGSPDAFPPPMQGCGTGPSECTGTTLATPPDAKACPCKACSQSSAPPQTLRVRAGDAIVVWTPRIPVVPSLARAEDVPLDPQAIHGVLEPDGPPKLDASIVGSRRTGFPYRVVAAPAAPLVLTVSVMRPLPPEAKGDRSQQQTYATGQVTILAR